MRNNAENIRLVVGLGNPGAEYENTRHNAGFMVIDRLLEKLPGSYQRSSRCRSSVWRGRRRGSSLFLQKPQTFMNISGEAIKCMTRSEKIRPEQIVIVFDDLDLPLGKLRIRRDGGDGGHNGIKSTIEHLGSGEFGRVRIGIGRQSGGGTVDHVLGEFDEAEMAVMRGIIDSASDAVTEILCRGIDSAMNKFNGLELNQNQVKNTISEDKS